MPAVVTVPLAEAKANLSRLVRRAEGEGACFTITRNNAPVARIVPYRPPAETASAFGSLSAYADARLRAREDGAFARAMEAKHADLP